MTKRETRVVNAFIECVKSGEYSLEYAITLLEDNNKYGYLTDEAKEEFYGTFKNEDASAEEIATSDEMPDNTETILADYTSPVVEDDIVVDEVTEDITDIVEPTVDEQTDAEVTEEGAEDVQAATEVMERE